MHALVVTILLAAQLFGDCQFLLCLVVFAHIAISLLENVVGDRIVRVHRDCALQSGKGFLPEFCNLRSSRMWWPNEPAFNPFAYQKKHPVNRTSGDFPLISPASTPTDLWIVWHCVRSMTPG